jgi:hypothetical protein
MRSSALCSSSRSTLAWPIWMRAGHLMHTVNVVDLREPFDVASRIGDPRIGYRRGC